MSSCLPLTDMKLNMELLADFHHSEAISMLPPFLLGVSIFFLSPVPLGLFLLSYVSLALTFVLLLPWF